MGTPESIRSLAAGMLFERSRSTVLQSLLWMMASLLASVLAGSRWGAPNWLLILLGVGLSINFLTFIGAYVYFAFTNTDALRSERYAIKKMQIQNGIIGDSENGVNPVIDARAVSNPDLKIEKIHE